MALRTVVGVDVETTSLDPARGEIIDVAAIRYDWQTGQEVERFEQLCRPTRPVSAEISALTGITNEMVAGKPAFGEIASSLQEFIGQEPLFAHHAEFDTKWLRYHGLNLAHNKIFDSYLLATVAWPEAASYNLGMLAAEQGLTGGDEHRAAADVELTWQLLRALQGQLRVSPEALNDVANLLQAVNAPHYRELFSAGEKLVPFNQPTVVAAAPLPVPSLSQVFAADGLLAQRVPGYAPRPGQQAMAEQVMAAYQARQLVLIEAGTGTGKTYSYLVPACLAAGQGVRVIISTYTRHLQDQLVETDIPTILKALGISLPVAVIKGRSNYVCERRLQQLCRRVGESSGADFSLAEVFLLIKVLGWLDRGGSGDLEKLNVSHQGRRIIRLLHADSLICRQQCQPSRTCPYARQRRAQSAAKIFVVNHAILAQASLRSDTLYRDALLIIDEAHHLEGATRAGTALDLSLGHVQEVADACSVAGEAAGGVTGAHIVAEAAQLVAGYQAWLLSAAGLLQGQHTTEIRLTPPLRQGSGWQKLVNEAANWRGRLKFILGLLRSLESKSTPSVQLLLQESIHAGERFGLEFENFVDGSAERIAWISLREHQAGVITTYLHDVALSLQPLFEQLTGATHGCVLTSATLATRGSFAYIKHRLGVEVAAEVTVPAPFNFKDNMLIYLVDDGPIPSDKNYDTYVYRALRSLSLLLRGRLLGLFTSQETVRIMYNLLIRDLYKAKIKVYAQKVTGGRHSMLDKFRRNPESILLGTMSFWEGIDVVGESLSCVVIPKLSFPAPTDPVLNALAAHENLNAFTDLFVPEMILRLRQGVGRLLRSTTDRGVVVILDPRLHRQQYGDEVLNSLPPATIHIGSGSDLLTKVAEWFGVARLRRWGSPGT